MEDSKVLPIKKQPKSYYVHSAIILTFMLGFGFLPSFGPVTQLGMRVLGIFIGVIYAWTIGQTVWPSILALVLLGFVGDMNSDTVLGLAFGGQTLLMVLFTIILCYCVSSCGVVEIVAKWIVSRKFAKKGPWSLALAFFIAAAITSILIVNTIPVVLLLWPIFYDVCKELNIKPFSTYPTIVLIGIVICGYAGSMVPPYAPLVLIASGILPKIAPGVVINPVLYSVMAFCITAVLCFALAGFYKLIGPKDLNWSGKVALPDQRLEFTKKQKISLIWLAIFACVMFCPQLLPKGLAITVFFQRLGRVGCVAFLVAIMMMTTFEHEQFLDIPKAMSDGVPWPLIFLLSAALYLSGTIAAPETGIGLLLNQLTKPILSGHGVFLTCAIMVVLTIIITNCINNVVTLSLFIPVAMGAMVAINASPVLVLMPVCFVCMQGVIMPAGSVLGAMLHGNTEWLKPLMIYRYATLGEAVVALVTICIGIPVAMFVL